MTKYCGVCDHKMIWDGEEWCCPNVFCEYNKNPNDFDDNFERKGGEDV